MAKIIKWCKHTETKINKHKLEYLEADTSRSSFAVASVADIVPTSYADPEKYSRILANLGKPGAAKYVESKLPTDCRSRSGDIGEILASSFVFEFTDYTVVLKLRWRDHREMAMRGDDILAVKFDPKTEIKFLKGEVKSRSALAKQTVADARKALNSNGGLPTPHALIFVADRLHEAGNTVLSDLVYKYQLGQRITREQLSHMMFVFTGNDPCKFLIEDLTTYTGKIPQQAIGLRVASHQNFIKNIFDKVLDNGKKP